MPKLSLPLALFAVTEMICAACGPSTTINREQAVAIATQSCRIPHLVLISEPQNVRASVMTLAQAHAKTERGTGTTHYNVPLNTRVWLVQIDGLMQLMGGPAPTDIPLGHVGTPTTPQPFWGTCSVAVDAESGTTYFTRG